MCPSCLWWPLTATYVYDMLLKPLPVDSNYAAEGRSIRLTIAQWLTHAVLLTSTTCALGTAVDRNTHPNTRHQTIVSLTKCRWTYACRRMFSWEGGGVGGSTLRSREHIYAKFPLFAHSPVITTRYSIITKKHASPLYALRRQLPHAEEKRATVGAGPFFSEAFRPRG